jgi:FkbH-like protein
LINKTNQFNLTTRRYNDEEYSAIMNDANAFGLYFRLIDRFGDNGIVSVVIGRKQADCSVLLDTWLMSCRVLGREVEQAVLTVVAATASKQGSDRLIGEYQPTARNQMVAEHYGRLGFELLERNKPDGARYWQQELKTFEAPHTNIEIEKL